MVKIDAESASGDLFFFLPDLTLERFSSAGMAMNGEERKFGTLRCGLTIIDRTGSSASAYFQLHER
jgi:hypothetical protein